MRTLIVRGAMITFFAITGLFGSAATVQFDGMSANVQTQSAEARVHSKPNCTSSGYNGDGGWICYERDGMPVLVP